MFISQRDQGDRLPDDAVRRPSAAGLRESSSAWARPIRRAKYGILTEAAPASQLVKANVAGSRPDHPVDHRHHRGRRPAGGPGHLGASCCPSRPAMIDTSHRPAPEGRDLGDLSSTSPRRFCFNLKIPRTEGCPLQPLTGNLLGLVRDFSNCNAAVERPARQISLATTTLFWGVSGSLRVIVFAWAAALGYTGPLAGRRGDRHRHRERCWPRCAAGSTDHRRDPAGHRDAACW